MNIAIEVDGPSHFEPVWGDDSLKRNKKYDSKKEGLIIGKGWHLIRIKQTKDFSKSRADRLYTELLQAIGQINGKNSSQKIIIEDK
jgi:very-short-patch-repair endonuclease